MSRKTNLLSISGGKDSTAMLLHALERDLTTMRCIFADTGHEHPDTYAYLDYLREKLGITIDVATADFSRQIAGKAEYIRKHWAEDGIEQEKIDLALETLKPTGNPFLDLCIWKGRFFQPQSPVLHRRTENCAHHRAGCFADPTGRRAGAVMAGSPCR